MRKWPMGNNGTELYASSSNRTPGSTLTKVSGRAIREVRSCISPLYAVPSASPFQVCAVRSPGHRNMGFHRYREALIIGIRAEGCQNVVA
jgi:hypothetical protein